MVGRTIGKYRIVEQIGRGGMGTVYKAVDESLDRRVAIKLLNADLIDQDSVERFRREAVTLARLNHGRIGAIHELTRDGQDLLMVMEFLDGETFEKLIERGPMTILQAVKLCGQVLDALQYAHAAGVVHRDLKPANVMVTPSGDIKVMDFGIARVQGSEHLTTNGFMVGTPAYMAPEQVRGEEVDPRMDLYAIAVVLYRLLTQRLPFSGDTAIAMIHSQLNNPPTPPRQFRADLPDWVVQVLERGLAKKPTDRFQSAAEFRAALENGLAGRASQPPSVPTGDEVTVGPMLTPPSMRAPVPPLTPTPAAAPSSAGQPPRTATPSPAPAPAAHVDGTVTLRAPHLATAGVLLTLLVIGVGVLGFLALRRPTTTIITQPGASTPAATPVLPAANAAVPATSTPSAPPPAAEVPATVTTPAATAPVPTTPKPAPPAAAPRARVNTPAAAPVAAAPPEPAVPAAASAPAENFGDIRTLLTDGRGSRETDALLSLEPGNLIVRSRADGAVLRGVPYTSIVAATYIRSRRPRAQVLPGAATLPENIGGSGLFGGARHWLTLQMAADTLIIRLEDRNVIRVINSVEARTGLKVLRSRDQ